MSASYKALRAEVSRRVYMTAAQCTGKCGYYLPYQGYPHSCYIGLVSMQRAPREPAMFVEQYINQQMAAKVLQ